VELGLTELCWKKTYSRETLITSFAGHAVSPVITVTGSMPCGGATQISKSTKFGISATPHLRHLQPGAPHSVALTCEKHHLNQELNANKTQESCDSQHDRPHTDTKESKV
jgi:hypothetical protein